jgi:hypothetical protein
MDWMWYGSAVVVGALGAALYRFARRRVRIYRVRRELRAYGLGGRRRRA